MADLLYGRGRQRLEEGKQGAGHPETDQRPLVLTQAQNAETLAVADFRLG